MSRKLFPSATFSEPLLRAEEGEPSGGCTLQGKREQATFRVGGRATRVACRLVAPPFYSASHCCCCCLPLTVVVSVGRVRGSPFAL